MKSSGEILEKINDEYEYLSCKPHKMVRDKYEFMERIIKYGDARLNEYVETMAKLRNN